MSAVITLSGGDFRFTLNVDYKITEKEEKTVKDLELKLWIKSQQIKFAVKEKAESFKKSLSEEDGGTESIIIAIVLIIIVVALAIVFREQIGNWVQSLFNSANSDIGDIIDGDAGVNAIPAAGGGEG